MAIRIVQLGSPRAADEGIRFGTVRRPPRGVKKVDVARRDFYDVWLPELAPSQEVLSAALSGPWSPARWAGFRRAYTREMSEPAARHLLRAFAALSHQTSFSVGCYCEDESHCHRSILRELLTDENALIQPPEGPDRA